MRIRLKRGLSVFVMSTAALLISVRDLCHDSADVTRLAGSLYVLETMCHTETWGRAKVSGGTLYLSVIASLIVVHVFGRLTTVLFFLLNHAVNTFSDCHSKEGKKKEQSGNKIAIQVFNERR